MLSYEYCPWVIRDKIVESVGLGESRVDFRDT